MFDKSRINYRAWTGTESHVNVAGLSTGDLHVFGLMQ
jgi:hypothetical protein